MAVSDHTIEETLARARQQLLAAQNAHGFWEGGLSSSALSTATAVVALAFVDAEKYRAQIRAGLDWLAKHQNADGGWGDTTKSKSNISTTTLCWAAFSVGDANGIGDGRWEIGKAEAWLAKHAGSLHPQDFTSAIISRYGQDKTFSVPILTTCALAEKVPWDLVQSLPFELAALPHETFKWLQLPVVSYALPALIAVGQVRHRRMPTRNPITRLLRDAMCERTLLVLEKIQPASGGFLEAIPLTSFVTMSLAGCGLNQHPVAQRGAQFLEHAAREDGSWPIDTNLATWVTTQAIEALGWAGNGAPDDPQHMLDWLLAQQHRQLHPYTNAAPGGWAWTDLSGGVPDADDTAGALLALKNLWVRSSSSGLIDHAKAWAPREAVELGVRWLLHLQNSDGGVPTFCKGWGALAFDRSAPDLTAHAIRAWHVWREEMEPTTQRRMDTAIRRAIQYLARTQREDGAWSPLWFGNQFAAGEENLTYGTVRVLEAIKTVRSLRPSGMDQANARTPNYQRAVAWLTANQNDDGGWGGAKGTPSSIEETALAVGALARAGSGMGDRRGVERGIAWLVEHTDGGRVFEPSPIGFYFAKLWYYEKLYPLIFTVAAMEKLRHSTR